VNKKIWIGVGIVAVILIFLLFVGGSNENADAAIEVKAKSGPFKIEATNKLLF